MRVFFWREAMRSFNAHRGLASTAIFSLTAALTLVAIFLLLSWNSSQAVRALGDRREMIVYLKDGVSDTELAPVVDKIRQLYGAPRYVSRAEAWEEFSQQIGDPDLLKAVEINPLPASLRLKLRPELLSAAAMETTATQILRFPEVEDVRWGAEWARRLDSTTLALHRGALLVGLIVALAIVFILYNTLRLTVLARRSQVEIMTRLGATDRFVSMPFLIEAAVLTTIASLFALALAFGLQRAVAANVAGLVFLPWPWIAAFIGGAILLGWLAAALVIGRILRHVGA